MPACLLALPLQADFAEIWGCGAKFGGGARGMGCMHLLNLPSAHLYLEDVADAMLFAWPFCLDTKWRVKPLNLRELKILGFTVYGD